MTNTPQPEQAHDIEVTPEMIWAGSLILDARLPDVNFVGDDDERLVRDIFLAMRRHSLAIY